MGRVARPHGLAGEVVVDLITNRVERVQPGACLSTGTAMLQVTSSRPFGHRWLVCFEGVADRSSAEKIRGETLFAEPLDDPGTMWTHELVGSEVIDTAGRTLGTVVALVANPASDLMELDQGALVPVCFVVEHRPGQVLVDVPEGLVDS